MFADKNHIHAITTAIGTLGGFQAAPSWFQDLSKHALWNILMAAVLVYQGGGNLDFTYSLVVATLFYLAMHLTKYVEVGGGDDTLSQEETGAEFSEGEETAGQEAAQEAAQEEAKESFYGDYQYY